MAFNQNEQYINIQYQDKNVIQKVNNSNELINNTNTDNLPNKMFFNIYAKEEEYNNFVIKDNKEELNDDNLNDIEKFNKQNFMKFSNSENDINYNELYNNYSWYCLDINEQSNKEQKENDKKFLNFDI